MDLPKCDQTLLADTESLALVYQYSQIHLLVLLSCLDRNFIVSSKEILPPGNKNSIVNPERNTTPL